MRRPVIEQPSMLKEEPAETKNGADNKIAAPRIAPRQRSGKKKGSRSRSKEAKGSRTRSSRPYPASSFAEALPLADAIHEYAAGQKVRRLTLLQQMQKSPTSSATKMLITNSGKYGITSGSYAAEWLELTDVGAIATAPGSLTPQKLSAQFQLAIERITPFSVLYRGYKGKRLPSREVMKDLLAENGIAADTLPECVDTFVVNVKDLGLLQTIAGSETLFPIEHGVEKLTGPGPRQIADSGLSRPASSELELLPRTSGEKPNWSKICFIITPIGEEGSEQRKHADLFLSSLIEPALKEFNLKVVRADGIGSPGMITSQVLEHVMRARLAIVDLSFHNPNAFYEMALRHACALPVVQVTRKCDTPPFDVNQVRTAMIDTSDIYTLVPKLETYRSEIATQVRAALADGTAGNPITVFFPGFKVTVPPEKC
jgi:hypothetical protein